MHGGLPGWGREVPSFAFFARERNLFPFLCLTLAVLVTAREQLGQQKRRAAGFPPCPAAQSPQQEQVVTGHRATQSWRVPKGMAQLCHCRRGQAMSALGGTAIQGMPDGAQG